MRARGFVAAAILAAWGAGLAVFAQRELNRSPRERLAEAAARVAPGATYFAVERAGKHVGFASTTIDTIPGGLQATDYFVADVDSAGVVRRASAQSVVRLSRGLALRDFTVSFGTGGEPTVASGRTEGDTLLEYTLRAPGRAPATTRVRLDAPLLLPTLVPLAMALGDPPEVGSSRTIVTFDPLTMTVAPIGVTVRAESVFVVVDSAAFDGGTKRWAGVHADSVRGWRLVGGDGSTMDGWTDDLGRLIALRAPGGFTMRRTAYEMAFENWRTTSPAPGVASAGSPDDRRARTLVTAGVEPSARLLDTLRVRLTGLDRSRLALDGGSQSLSGDTVTVVRDATDAFLPSFRLPPDDATRRRFARELRAEPLLETEHPAIVALARRLRSGDRRAEHVAARLARWVHDSLAKAPSPALPSAIGTLRSRSGDSNEHAQLFVALARAAGIPARAVSGMVLHDGTPHYHAWAEVMLQEWVAVDPTLGQFPADAAHVRMVLGGLQLQPELSRVIARAKVETVHSASAPSGKP